VPQVPQLLSSVLVSTQVPAQSFTEGVVLLQVHAPPEQVCPAMQALPHVPQLLGLSCKSTQLPLHSVSPGPHEHLPPMQEP
jgi:hypothetical protein